MKKKNPLILAAAVLCILCLAYAGTVFYQNSSERRAKEAAETAAIVMNRMGDINSLSFQNGEETPLSFVKKEGLWQYAADETFPLEQSFLTSLEEKCQDLTATRKLEEGDALSAYGLEAPTHRVTIKNAAGSFAEILIGNQQDSGDYYAKKEGDPAVYTIPPSLPGALPHSLNELARVEQFPSIQAADIKEIQIKSPGAELHLTREELERNPEEKSLPPDSSGPQGSSEPEESSQSQDSSGPQAPTESARAALPYQELRSAISSLQIDSCYLWKSKPEDLAVCGLSAPYAVISYYYENKDGNGHITLLVGESGEEPSRYVKFADSDMICEMSAASLEHLLSLL